MPLTAAEVEKYKSIFYPHTLEKTKEAIDKGGRFAYYTTADVAINILKTREIWMRNTRMMNDFMEFTHGFDCLKEAYNSDVGKQFNSVLDNCFSGLSKELQDSFNAWVPGIERDTYIACLAVHEHQSEENKHGRLSMWRAYGGRTGVALVIKGHAMFTATDDIGVYSSPVAYFDTKQFIEEFGKVTAKMSKETEYLKSLGRETVKNTAFHMFRFAALCTKHPGFAEEQEWRLLTTPGLQESPLIRKDVEIVRGTPQIVLKLMLQDLPDKGLHGVNLPDLLDHIIIGPCDFPDVVYQAFHKTLIDCGIDPKGKIQTSNIPLRHF